MPSITARPSFIGRNGQIEDSEIDHREFPETVNLEFSTGTARVREGYTEVEVFADPVLGVFDWPRADGSVGSLVKAGSNLYYKTPSSNFVLLSTDFTPNGLASFGVLGDRVYIADGGRVKVTDGVTVHFAEISRPAVALSLAAIAGALEGTYDYKWTYFSSTWGQESPGSDATASVIVSAQGVSLSGFVPSSDPRVDKIRIYRRKTSANEAVWFFVDEIAHTVSSYNDTKLDQDTSNNVIAPLSYNQVLPNFSVLHVHQGVMFLAGPDDQMWHSSALQPWAVTSAFRVGGEGAYEKIRSFESYAGLLIVYKERSIWIVSGLSRESFEARAVATSSGSVGTHAVVQYGGIIYSMSEEHIVAYDGTQPAPLTIDNSDLIRGRNTSRDQYVFAWSDEELQAVLFAFSSGASLVNDTVIAYFVENSARVKKPSISELRYPRGLATVSWVTNDPMTRDRDLWLGFSDGLLGQKGGETDQGDPIPMRLRSLAVDGDAPSWRKHYSEAHVKTRANRITPATVSILLDGKERKVRTIDLERGVSRLRLASYGEDCSIIIDAPDAGGAEFLMWAIEFQYAGFRDG